MNVLKLGTVLSENEKRNSHGIDHKYQSLIFGFYDCLRQKIRGIIVERNEKAAFVKTAFSKE